MAVAKPTRLRDSRLFRAGLGLFILGSGPLIGILIAAQLGLTFDPNPNPVGFGLLAFLTFWPSVGLLLAGLFFVRSARREKER